MPVLVNFYGDSPILANVRSVLVDLGGVEPPSEQLNLSHAKIFRPVVNKMSIMVNTIPQS
jgi:hypothetical protein